MKNKYRCLFFAIAVVFFSCDTPPEEKKEAIKRETPVAVNKIPTPDFNADSAYVYIQNQVDFGPRVPNSKAHAECAEFLAAKLRSFNLDVTIQEGEVIAFDNNILKLKNIIAAYKPELDKRILLFAHWDTRPFADKDTKDQNKPIDGANDGGSGVGVLFEIARQLSLFPPNIGVDIILFDAEDYGQPEGTMMQRKPDTWCLGSQFWAKNPHRENYSARYGILLDMVGAKNATFTMEGTSMQYAPFVVKKVWGAAEKLGYSEYFINKKTDGITDDHFYVNTIAGIPSIDIIQYDPSTPSSFGTYHHTHRDNMDIIDKNTLKAVGQTLLEVIYAEN